jgi:O-glycosyl hydrolase
MRFGVACLLVSAALVVSGCGGSSSGTVTSPPPPTTPTITWPTPSPIVYGTALSSTQLDASAGGVAGTFSYSPAAGTVLSAGSTQKLSVTFTPTDTTDYTSATASVLLTVNQAAPTLAWAAPAGITYGTALGSTQLDATANVAGTYSYSPAAGTLLTVGSQMLSVTFTPTDTTDYTSATGSVALVVNKATPTISWATPSPIVYETALSSTQLDAGSGGVAGTFAYSPATGTVLTAGSQMLSAIFTPTDTTDYQSATDSVTLTVSKATPTITWPTPAPVTQGATLGSAQLDATSNVPGAFSYTPASGTVLNTAGAVQLSTTFTPNDTTDYATATAEVSLTVNATVTVDYGSEEQIIRGFGGSTAWLGQLTDIQAAALFNGGTGLGLSILRIRIDPTGSASTNNWATSNWAQEVANAQEAVTYNPNAIVFASPWTPPASMKTSSTSQAYYSGTPACSPGAGYCGGYLNPSNYAAYATYLEDFVTYFNTNADFDLYAISMQNEPDYSDAAGENYESCSWTPQQMASWIDSLTANGATNPLTAKLIMPESYNFSQTQVQTALEDSNAEPLISILAGHLYGVSPTSNYYTLAQQYGGKDVWMTEHSLTPSGSQPTITDALAAAEEIHNSMVTGNFNAYVWWWIWDDPNDGVNYGLINSNTTTPTPTYYGYALGQFAKYILPGYHRYDATANPSANVYVSAYAGIVSGTQHYTIVAINAGATAVSQSFTIENGTITTLNPLQTTSSAGLDYESAITVSNGQFTYTLPAQSITTFEQ